MIATRRCLSETGWAEATTYNLAGEG